MDSTPKPNYLIRIAGQMKDQATERAAEHDPAVRTKPVTHVLAGGARLALYLTRNTMELDIWRLRVSRPGKFPSDSEMTTFRRDFGVGGGFIEERVRHGATVNGAPVECLGIVTQWTLKSDRRPDRELSAYEEAGTESEYVPDEVEQEEMFGVEE